MTVSVSVVVPYRADGGPRDAAWSHLQARWADTHPGWQVVVGACPDGPWVKALAVADALTRADGDTLVIADADVWSPDVADAVVQLQAGRTWAIPHRLVCRLTAPATASVLAGNPFPATAGQHTRRDPVDVSEAYMGVVGGGIVVLGRALYNGVPLDPRFVGWGLEDLSWGTALTVTAGRPSRGTGPLWHLWHPPQPRISRAVGSRESLALYRRYRAANTPALIAGLLAEISGPARTTAAPAP